MTWNITNLRGARETVKSAITADKKLPASVKAFACSQIDELPKEVAGCRVDAYCQDIDTDGGMKLTRNVSLTVVAFKL